MATDKDQFFDAVWEMVESEAKDVLTLGWDGGAPGTSGCHWVTEWHGLYFLHSSDVDDEGPFHSLDEALAEEVFEVVTAGAELSSDVLTLEQLKDIGLRLVGEGETVWINDQRFVRRDGELRPAE